MRKIKVLLSAFIFIITLTGCLRVNTTINLNPDGSGTIEETVFMKGAILDMIRQFASSFDESGEAEEFSFYKEEEQIAKAIDYGEGVAFLSGEEIFETDWEGYKVTYAFTDINKLKIDPSPDNKVNLGDEVETSSETVREYLTFSFKKGSPADLTIKLPQPDFSKDEETEIVETEVTDSLNDDSMTEMFKNMFDGMRMSVNLKLNGQIEETNAAFVNGNVITMIDVDFTNILLNEDVIKTLESKKPESMEDFREITKDIEGIKIEFNDEVTVRFR